MTDGAVNNIPRDRAIVKFIQSHPWAITQEALETIQEVVCNHMDGIPVTINAEGGAKSIGHIKHPDVAIIPVHGTIAKKLYGLEAMSGGRTTLDIKEDIQTALNDNKIKGIVLDVDSPGGTVDGTKELADFIMSAREQKPIVAYANGQMASAAYWLGSAASQIVAFDTSQVGSIGVIISHRDYSKREEMMGVKTTHIYAGKYKTMGTPYEPLSKESKEYLQESVDYYYTMFVDAVAEHRGVEVETVLGKMAEGRVFIGNQSKEVGLVDLIGNLEDAIKLAKQGGNKVTIQEAVKEFGATNLLAHLVTTHGAELPNGIVEAYKESTKPVIELPPEVAATIEALQQKVETLEQEKLDAEAKLKEEQEAIATKERREQVIDKLEVVGLADSEDFIEVGMTIEPERFDAVIEQVKTLRHQVKEVTSELFDGTENATSESKMDEVKPNTFDAACNFVAKRDDLDIEEAISAAAKEFPELYTASIQPEGGNE